MTMMMKCNIIDSTSSCHTNTGTRNYPPTTPFSSNFSRRGSSTTRKHYFSVTSIILLWYAILLCWCGPQHAVNGLPLVTSKSSSIPRSDKDVLLDSSLIFGDGYIFPQQWYLWDKNMQRQERNRDDEDYSSVQKQEATGLDETNNNELMMMMMQPRKKKGLSYLTKFYTEAFHNNAPISGGSSSGANSNAQSYHDNSNHFFGISGGSSSAEQRYPSSVRRKLSLYPAITSHSVFMSPWSRLSSNRAANTGRSPTMRLRWGK